MDFGQNVRAFRTVWGTAGVGREGTHPEEFRSMKADFENMVATDCNAGQSSNSLYNGFVNGGVAT